MVGATVNAHSRTEVNTVLNWAVESACMDPGRFMVLHELAGVEPFHVGDVHQLVRRTCKVKPGGFPGFDSPTLKSVKVSERENVITQAWSLEITLCMK